MSDFLMAYYDQDRAAVVVRLQSGTEVAVMDADEAESFGEEVLAASRKESTGYEEFLAQETGEDSPEVAATTCILTGEAGENPDDCTTHEHQSNN